MNILFVNYGDFTANSLNHIGGFAGWLAAQGHACAVAVPSGKDTLAAVPDPQFLAVTYAEVLANPRLFPDGRAADVLHAWTPREGVRRFVLAHQKLAPARLVVHLEDNEEHLIEAFGGKPVAELRDLPEQEFPFPMVDGLSHPVRLHHLLRLADGITHIVDRLAEFAPAGTPTQLLPPGVDFTLYAPQAPDTALRASLGLRPGEKVIAFTGSVTFANAGEMRELYEAVRLLNQRGTPTRLVRTGLTLPDFPARLGFDPAPFVIELGFVEKSRLPRLLALADVLVQPGRPGPFNDYRLPSKLPEFLASGRPVILPAANVGLALADGREALVLPDATAAAIADACARVFADPMLASALGAGGVAFARRHFDLAANSHRLLAFYDRLAAAPANPAWAELARAHESDLALQVAALRANIAAAPASPATAALLARLDDLRRAAHQLDADLHVRAGTVADLRRHAAGLEETRTALQKDIGLVRAHAAEHARQLEAEIARLRNSAERALQRAREISETAEREVTRLQDELYQSQYRVQRMTATFSWRGTAWLRSLRRALLDPILGHRQPPPPPPPAPVRLVQAAAADFTFLPAAPAMRVHLDAPRQWPEAAAELVIRGWVLAEDEANALQGVRARVAGRLYPGQHGLPRPDVGRAFPRFAGADYAGFKLTIALQPGDGEVVLEALDAGGAWRVFHTQVLGLAAANAPGSYSRWVEQYDTPSAATRQALADAADRGTGAPVISLLLPVYNTPERWLVRALDSVRAQTYPHWELCIADDASTAPHVRAVLAHAAAADRRIKVAWRPANGHICAASNTALELATGAFTGLLDHDDELAPHALHCVAAVLRAHPGAEVVYTDEDKLDENGARFDPHFKPDWNPDLLTSQNYLSHLTVYRTATLRAAGGFRPGFEGAQDWDLALRITEHTPADRIHHVPRVLYHWRAIEGSTALQLEGKDYAAPAARRALEEHFARRGERVTLESVAGRHWHARRARPDPAPLVTLVIPTRNRRELLVPCLESILAKTAYPNFEILVADNDSDDPELHAFYARMRAAGRFEVLACPGPFNFSAINNRAVAHARGELIGLLNNDLEAMDSGWLDELVAHAVRPGIGCVGAKLYYPDLRIQHAGVITGLGGVAGHPFKGFTRDEPGTPQFRPHVLQNLTAVTAACLLVRKAVYLEAGGLDEQGLAVAFNDVDFCLKVQARGLRNVYTPFAELLHHESASRGAEDTPEKIRRFQREIALIQERWGDRLLADPAYNPNLSLDSEDFALAFPPRVPPLLPAAP